MNGKPLALPNEVVTFRDADTGDKIFVIVESVRQSIKDNTNYYCFVGFPNKVYPERGLSKPWFI